MPAEGQPSAGFPTPARFTGVLPDALVRSGLIEDDDTEHRELVLRAEVQRGRKALVLRFSGRRRS